MNKIKIVILLCALSYVSCKKPTLFEQIPSSHSGIDFNNKITETDTINPLDMVNIYNGGGVGVGDFNNDGLQDLYFSGNMVANRLYLNQGDFKFKDITKQAGVEGMGRWGRGVSVVDINNDGLMDIYVCNTIYPDSNRRVNLLYVNQGLDKEGIPHFKEMAKEYGLDIHVQSTMAAFFDYDNDGNLDMYLTVNEAHASENPNIFKRQDASQPSVGKLMHNEWDPVLKHPVFHDVSAKAGIKFAGLGHAATIVDINRDGWKDIYVSNDFLAANVLYINNHDGTFTDRSKEYFKHTSYNAMGQDVIDINNDGLADVFELDMNPEDNYRKKMMMGANSYQSVQNFDYYGYQYQYVRNTLQLNQGPRVLQNDTIGSPAFSEIGFMSGVAQTDWSWTPLIADFNNDGYRDIIITNGFPKDVTDHDFMTYRQNAYVAQTKKQILDQIPSVKIHNYAYQNKGDLTFNDASKSWGLDVPTFSNGAVYADLNNDGAMDMIINNINDEALIYKNTARSKDTLATHYLQVKFKGDSHNPGGLGTWVDIYYEHGKHQVSENNPYRGYLSTDQNIAHFGLGKISMVDSVVVRWQNGKKQVLKQVKANQVLTVNIANAKEPYTWAQPKIASSALFKEVSKPKNVEFTYNEYDFVDFNIQKLLPHKLSAYNPALAVGDVNGDGLDDMVTGGSSLTPAKVFLQQPDGKFITRDLLKNPNTYADNRKDEGILLFDANGDGKLDLYISSGGYLNASGSNSYQDRIYINDGQGNFTLSPDALPVNHTSKLCVRAFDYNKDGKPDLFVSGRVDPWNYPKPVSSFIFRNDSKNSVVRFTDVTNEVAPALKNIGMICDALFTDYDNDGWPDLVLAGEFMPVTFLKNDHGVFKNATSTSGVSDQQGWWNSIVTGDFRHTGRMDYIVGNVGLNTLYKASNEYPVFVTAKDFDKNGSFAAIPSIFLPDQNGDKKEFPAMGREDMLKQMISMKKKFTNYKSYATATMDQILTDDQRKGAIRLKANQSQSCYLRNDGNGKFIMIPLPKQAQISAINGMVVDDFDGDGNLDVIINGNDFGTEVGVGRYDALNGLMLKGDGKGNFSPQSILKSGIYIPGDGKALVKLQASNGNYLLAASQNRGPMKVFELKRPIANIKLLPDDASAVITDSRGQMQKQEFYYGASFLSQSGRFLTVNKDARSVQITNSKGQIRTVSFK
jgi:hypothetical protein